MRFDSVDSLLAKSRLSKWQSSSRTG